MPSHKNQIDSNSGLMSSVSCGVVGAVNAHNWLVGGHFEKYTII